LERILFIGVAVLLIFGPEKVPVIARTLGNLVREFQNALHPAAAPAPSSEAPPVKTRKRRPLRRKKIS
jgi:TatA/E family protein of Tat protein translocase